MVKVKICGITNWRDAHNAVESGANYLGFNFYKGSPRYVTPAAARSIVRRLPKRIVAVGVFVNTLDAQILKTARSVGLHELQLHGDETPDDVARLSREFPVIKALRVKKSFRAQSVVRFPKAAAILLDGFHAQQRGGTGKTFDWKKARVADKKAMIFVAGGLNPENVADAIRIASPYAVDVCSGVEESPRRKDKAKLVALMNAVRGTRKTQKRISR